MGFVDRVVLAVLASSVCACRGLDYCEARESLVGLESYQRMLPYQCADQALTLHFRARSVDLAVHHIRAGDAQSHTKVLLVHGYPDSLLTWAELLPCLLAYDVRALDLPGQGLTETRVGLLWDEMLEPESQADAVWSFLQSVGWASFGRDSGANELVVVGHSFGGLVASMLAAKHSEHISKLVLIDPEGVPRSSCEYLPGERQQREGFRGAFAGSFLFAWFDSGAKWESEARRQYLELSGGVIEPCCQRVLEYATLTKIPQNYVTSNTLVRQGRAKDIAQLAEASRGMKGRTLLLWGTQDRLFPAFGKGCTQHDVRFGKWFDTAAVAIEGAGHLPQREKPQETAGRIRAFLDE